MNPWDHEPNAQTTSPPGPTHPYIHTYIHTYIRTYIHNKHTYIHTYIHLDLGLSITLPFHGHASPLTCSDRRGDWPTSATSAVRNVLHGACA